MKLTPTPQPTFSGLLIAEDMVAVSAGERYGRRETGQITVHSWTMPLKIKLVSGEHPGLDKDEIVIRMHDRGGDTSTMRFRHNLVGDLTDRFDRALAASDGQSTHQQPVAETELDQFRKELPEKIQEIFYSDIPLIYESGVESRLEGSLSGYHGTSHEPISLPYVNAKLKYFLPKILSVLEQFKQNPNEFWPIQEVIRVEYRPRLLSFTRQLPVQTLKMVGPSR